MCALYDVGHDEGVDYLVMEYLEGESLAERLQQGPLPTPELLRIAVEAGAHHALDGRDGPGGPGDMGAAR